MRSYREVEVVADTGEIRGFLVVDGSSRALSFGGMRVDPSVTRELVVELAENMSLKLAGHGSPVGGAKAGICASPADPRLKDFLGRFAQRCRDLLTRTTILGKDMGAKQWMLDEIYASLGIPQLEVARRTLQGRGCPQRIRDLCGYIKHMTGIGVFWSIEQALGGSVRGARVLIQGFGVVGSGVAWHLVRAGAHLVGVSDHEKAILGLESTDLEVLMAARTASGVLVAEHLPTSCKVVARDKLLEQPSDVLVLAASSNVVDSYLASRIQAPLVIEGANLALQPEARSALWDMGTRVVPDVVANSASAALVGHQLASGNSLDPEALWDEIESNIRRSTDAADDASRKLGVDPKRAFQWIAQTQSGEGYDQAPEAISAGK